MEVILHTLEGDTDFLAFQETLWKELNQLEKGIFTDVLETKD